jgi:hypothetical protein
MAFVNMRCIRVVEQFRTRQVGYDPTINTRDCIVLTVDMTVHQRDDEYIVECLRVLLQQERIAQRTTLSLENGDISDAAINIFAGFLRETTPPCRLRCLDLWSLPDQQARRLLEALHTNRYVKELCIFNLKNNEGALWIADLLRHKTDIVTLEFRRCRFSLARILPFLHGQTAL